MFIEKSFNYKSSVEEKYRKLIYKTIMDDHTDIKACILRLNKQLNSLEVDLNKLTAKPLDEQLLLLNDERAKLDLTNKYAYVLSSLMFSYMKVLNVKDMSPIRTELARVKSYMDRAKAIDNRSSKETERQQQEQDRAKKVIKNALDGRQQGPAISKVNFQGKHTRFENGPKDDDKEVRKEQDIIAREISQTNKDAKKVRSDTHKVSKKRRN